jgi:prepilin-type N-terminal cleavage/methylation domain-containing protein
LIARSAFTLVELLVVIAIIGMLVTLLMAALFKARALGEDLECRKDISELHKAVAAFCTDPRLGALGYMPSKFDPSGGDAASQNYILRLFPRIDSPSLGGSAQLEGHQCLVFFLAGPNGNGFSTNPRNPLDNGADRIGPFFDFKQTRLTNFNGSPYKSYLDRYGKMPIAYFSATQWSAAQYIPNQYGNDNASLGVQAYVGQNTTTWQLISAGRNAQFGTSGATWTPLTSTTVYPSGSAGYDDVTNFSSSLLGARQ